MKVLVVGVAGHVGSIVRPALEREHECRLFDRRPLPDTNGRCIIGDVNDEALVQQAVQDMDAVVYLAMGIKPGTEKVCSDIGPAFAVNVVGWYRFLREGLAAGVRRFVYASTLSVYCHRRPERIDEHVPADAWDPYGISKRQGEALCHAAAHQYPDATIIVLRMVWPLNEAGWEHQKVHRPQVQIQHFAQGPNDPRRLYLAALACDAPGAHIVQTSGDVEGSYCPNTRATELLGWAPRNE